MVKKQNDYQVINTTVLIKYKLMKKSILYSIFICASFIACKAQEQQKKPNVIFIFSDDQRFNSLSMTGDPIAETPNIDQLAKEGVFFNNAYITSPICGPSRANIFTAQWERKNKIGFTSVSKHVISEKSYQDSWQVAIKTSGIFHCFYWKTPHQNWR